MEHFDLKVDEKKVIARLKGGLGNQLFIYAAAKALATHIGAELSLDVTSGFKYDYTYKRVPLLKAYNVKFRYASAWESMIGPIGRVRRTLRRASARLVAPERRSYIEEGSENQLNDSLFQQASKNIYLDGYWQREEYFHDIAPVLLKELGSLRGLKSEDQEVSQKIDAFDSIGVHVRTYAEIPHPADRRLAARAGFISEAVAALRIRYPSAQIFVFSDDIDWVRRECSLPEFYAVTHNHRLGNDGAAADMWLLSRCRHFVLSNSTFGWWAAWLAKKGCGNGLARQPCEQIVI